MVRNRIISSILLFLCLIVVSGLTTSVCALMPVEAANHCCDGTASSSAAECSESECRCPACTPAERSSGRLALNLIDLRFAFPAQDFILPRSLRSAAIDYPPEAA